MLAADVSYDEKLFRLQHCGQILVDFSRMAADSSDVECLLQLTVVQAARGIGIGHTKIMRHRPEAGDLLMVAGVGWHAGVVGHVSLGSDLNSAPGQALQTRQPVITLDLPNDPEVRYPPVLRAHGIVSALNVPIAVDGLVWGVLEVDSDTPRQFDADHANFLLTMGNILGQTLHGLLRLERVTQEAADATLAHADQKVLFSELQHRNKNDFQLILSLLLMQKRKQTDPEARRGFTHVMDRVSAIGMAHDQLSAREGKSQIELAEYLHALCGNLQQRKEGVQIRTGLMPLEMPHERAVPLGLIVNELVTNALKHAFPGNRSGMVSVTFDLTCAGEGTLCVRDDGIGMGPPRPGSSGTELVGLLVQQMGGEMEQERQVRGTGFCIRFPLVG